MNCEDFPDNSKRLFGRDPDLAYLLGRCRQRGITAVVGRPLMGKSSLLIELSRQLSRQSPRRNATGAILNLSAPPAFLVGFAESPVEHPDQMLRVVSDLYCRWLSDARYRDQAKVLYAKYKEDLIGKTGEAVGTIFKELSKLGGTPVEGIGGLVEATFKALAAANRDLIEGMGQAPRLQIEQSRELLHLLQSITNCQLVLVLDAWEKSPNLEMESNILDSFLHHVDEWPPCHIVLGVRSDEIPRAMLRKLRKGFEGAMEIFELPPMHLEEAAGPALLHHIRSKVSGASQASDAALLEMIAGYPGVVSKWTASYNFDRVATLSQLKDAALEAQNCRYSEFDSILPKLADNARAVCARLSLMPACASADGWPPLRQFALDGEKTTILDTLKNMGVLESALPPAYGHATRLEAARQWFTQYHPIEFSEICEELIFKLGGKIREVAVHETPFASSLVELEPLALSLNTSAHARSVCIAAQSLLGVVHLESGSLLGTTSSLDASRSMVAPLLGVGLFNSLNAASEARKFDLRDAFLNELRALSVAFPEDRILREWLAKALYNMGIDFALQGYPERRIFLDELRTLAAAYPGESAPRLWFASALVNEIIQADEKATTVHREAMLHELRSLSRSFPEDAAVRERLARGLLNALTCAKRENVPVQRDALLEQLREMAIAFPSDAEVREQLAMGLFNTLNTYDDDSISMKRKQALLEELRTLANAFPQDAPVRLRLAKGLVNFITNANLAATPGQGDTLFEELRTLAGAFPSDAALWVPLGMGLFQMIRRSLREEAPQRSSEFLSSLRELYHSHPVNAELRELLAFGLSEIITFQNSRGVPGDEDALRRELLALSVFFSDDPGIRRALERSTTN